MIKEDGVLVGWPEWPQDVVEAAKTRTKAAVSVQEKLRELLAPTQIVMTVGDAHGDYTELLSDLIGLGGRVCCAHDDWRFDAFSLYDFSFRHRKRENVLPILGSAKAAMAWVGKHLRGAHLALHLLHRLAERSVRQPVQRRQPVLELRRHVVLLLHHLARRQHLADHHRHRLAAQDTNREVNQLAAVLRLRAGVLHQAQGPPAGVGVVPGPKLAFRVPVGRRFCRSRYAPASGRRLRRHLSHRSHVHGG